ATSPVDTPDCFLGYVVPDGELGPGRLRAVAGGFQRSSHLTGLEEVPAEAGAFTVGAGSAEVDGTLPDVGRLRAGPPPASAGPGTGASRNRCRSRRPCRWLEGPARRRSGQRHDLGAGRLLAVGLPAVGLGGRHGLLLRALGLPPAGTAHDEVHGSSSVGGRA